MTRDALRARIVAALDGYVREPNPYLTTRTEKAADAVLAILDAPTPASPATGEGAT